MCIRDRYCKKLLSNKQILAYVMKGCIPEYADIPLEDIPVSYTHLPAVMSYVRKAADTKLISEARSVMVASKEKGIELVKKQQLDLLATDENMKDIMKRSEVEGTLMEIYKNKANNGAGEMCIRDRS